MSYKSFVPLELYQNIKAKVIYQTHIDLHFVERSNKKNMALLAKNDNSNTAQQ